VVVKVAAAAADVPLLSGNRSSDQVIRVIQASEVRKAISQQQNHISRNKSA
jgi:hypothetical protein